MTKQLAFYFDSSQCSGCKTCQVACKDKHNLTNGIRWRNVYEVSGGEWEKNGNNWISKIRSYNVSMSCNHCQDPICMQKCPNKAIYKTEEGIVLIDSERCMGCNYCQWSCPYGALHLDTDAGKMTKCTLCADYIAEGKPPACVAACPMRVLDFGDYEELKAKYGSEAETYPLPPAHYTHPSIVIKPHQSFSKDINWKVINREEVENA